MATGTKKKKKPKKIPIEIPIIIHSKTVSEYQKPKYDIDKILARLSELLFTFERPSKTNSSSIILGVIAKHGSINEQRIADLAFKKSHTITRDVVRYRLSNEKNESNFLKLGVVTKKKGKMVGNIKSKNENVYHLTLKGLIASLAKTSFEDNYIVSKYMKLFSHLVKSNNIPSFALLLIKYNLAMFMIKNVIDGSNLTNLNNIDAQIFSMNDGDPLLSFNFPHQVKNKKLDQALTEIRIWYHIYSQVYNQAINELTNDGLVPANKKDPSLMVWKNTEMSNAINVLPNYIKYWYDYVERIQFEKIENMEPFQNSEEMTNDEQIDPIACNVIAKQILKKYSIKSNFSLVEPPTFF